MDEPCLGVSEKNQQSPGSKGFHRYLCVRVVRDDKPVTFMKDLGLSKNFKSDPFVILGGVEDDGNIIIEHTVGELIDIAEQLREKQSFDQKELSKLDKIKK
jgi:hypothetical protein